MREKIAQLATRVGEQPPAPVLIVGHVGNGQREGHSQFLISYAGYWYGDFLFDCGIIFAARSSTFPKFAERLFEEVKFRAEEIVRCGGDNDKPWLINLGQGYLLRGMATCMLGDLDSAKDLSRPANLTR